MDPLDFLAAHAPFDALSPAGRDRLAASLEITWARAGGRIVTAGADNPYLWTVRKGLVRVELDGQRVVDLGPGEIFGLTSLSEEAEAARLDVVAVRDCLLYRLSGDAVRTVCETELRFSRFFFENLAERLRRLAESQVVRLTSDLGEAVGDLVARTPVTLELAPDAEPTVEEAARAMEEAGVSSVLLLEPGGTRPVGIVTDRDLRGRVLARGRGASTPIREVMTHPVDWIPAETPGAEALLQLLRQGRHHLLIEDDGALRGVVTTSDLLRRHLQGPTALLDRLRSARSPDQLTDWTAWVGSMVETLHHSGTRATDIGRIVAAVNDALGARLLAWTEAELGEAPCAYAWLVHGSEGRQEQSFVTDQDNALAYADATPSAEAYFRRLAETMIESLIRVGFPPCAGGFMASHWCHPVAEWERLFTSWIEEPDPESLMRVVNFFDWRSTHGTLDLAPLDAIVAASGRNHRFLGQLARASMRKRPPLGLFRQIVEDEGGVDLKSGALMPISGLARLYAVEAGDHHGSTLQRLSRAARAGVLSADGAELLAEAFRFTFGLRLRCQLADRAAGRPLGSMLDLDRLDAAERHHLREVFLAIRRLQRTTEERLGSGGLG